MSKTILHVIESLVIGGAEVLLVESLKGFTAEYRHVVVYMRPPATLLSQVVADKIYFLDYKVKRNIATCILRLRKIIRNEGVNLIHAHHYWPTVVSRLAKPNNVPLLFTVHSPLSADAFQLNRLSLYLERLTYSKSHHPVFISEAVKSDYNRYVSVKGSSSVILNFAGDIFYEHQYKKENYTSDSLHLVAVGTLKASKNYSYLLKVFSLLKDYPVYLDIVGDGPCLEQIKEELKAHELENVVLRGLETQPYKILRNYDGFILASTYEGFGIAAVEAMAVGLPCLLSDIEAHREVAGDAALFFDLASPSDCAAKTLELLQSPILGQKLSERARERALKYTRSRYLEQLNKLYRLYLS
ncbi:glycosyltransferase [Pontibacter cellulosilyticus]|uniref:Glycosyltransferase n=1 Tax=Pontibacter cellulosilyticus TaxID=1720253 RepID=A0A923SKB3_9BACT|nr:glycosyltransferase [Pontibacter cellulosilyticus]MBC5993611.1 glycosyltransferase [Pontibacter cellulosilyticus]